MFTPNDTIKLEQSTYTIDRLISDSGAQGTVWRVTGKDNKLYALKVTVLKDTYSPTDIKRIIKYSESEISFLRGLPSDALEYHITPCLDYGSIYRGGYDLPAFIMPLYKSDLKTYLEQQKLKNKVITIQQWLRWFWQLLQALQYMQKTTQHESLSVHRDLKPANLLLDQEQNLYLSDFGIARESNIVGTYTQALAPTCSAPEQIFTWYITESGHPHFYITPAVDIYAAALILHGLIAGDTKAQDKLVNFLDDKNSLRDQHKAIILTENNRKIDHKLNHKVGLLGEIGGLTDSEYDNFLSLLNQRFLADTQTTVVPSQRSLPNYGDLVHNYGDLVRDMLAPLPKDRPDVNKVLSKLLEFEDQLYPELSHFKLAHSADHLPLTVSLGKPLAISLDIKGKGLPIALDWLEIKINDRLIRNVESQLINSQPSPSQKNKSEYLRYYRIYLPAFEDATVEHYTLTISSMINGKEKTIVKDINVVIDPKYLWQKGRRVDALRLSPRKIWLDEWEKSAKTVGEKSELINVIKELKTLHPNLTASLNERVERINSQKPLNTKFYIIGGIIIILLSIIIYLLLSGVGDTETSGESGSSVSGKGEEIINGNDDYGVGKPLSNENNELVDEEPDQTYKNFPFFKAAQKGDARSQYDLGFRYVQDKNYDEAMRWYKKAAEQKYAPAQAGLGWLYYRKDTPEDDKEAVKWFRLAVEQNNADGQYLLGLMYGNGRGGLAQDHTEAQHLYCQAAKQGQKEARKKLEEYSKNYHAINC